MVRKRIEDWYQIPKNRVKLTRAESFTHSGGTRIDFIEYPIVRYTPSGAWISLFGLERFVNLRAVKQFASTTKEGALDQLKYRKRRQLKILGRQLDNAEKTLKLLESGKLESDNYAFVEFY